MSGLDVFKRIIFPQMLQVTLPPMGNTIIAVLNEASLGFAIGYMDIIGRANLLSQVNFGTKNVEVFFAAATIYWICSIAIGKGVNLIERYCEIVCSIPESSQTF